MFLITGIVQLKKYERLTTESFIIRAALIHHELYDYKDVIYVNSKTKVVITCNTCKPCQYKNLKQNQSMGNEMFLLRAEKIHGDKFTYIEPYVAKRFKMNILCNLCGTIFRQCAGSHLEGRGCKTCQYKNLKQNTPMDVSMFELQCASVHNDKYRYFQDYKGTSKKIKIYCSTHKRNFYQEAGAHRGGQGCPKCRISKGELLIYNYLTQSNILFEHQKQFDGCKNKLNLKFDFYLPEFNCCIEYDGQQHFENIERFGNSLCYTQRNDAIKTKYCLDNNIKLIRIPYYEKKNLTKILNQGGIC